MNDPTSYRRWITGEGGLPGFLARTVFAAIEPFYGVAIRYRNRGFDRTGPRASLPIPVISIGNLTVGGTGKTPFVIELVRRLHSLGRHPAVVARGYGGVSGEPNDEELLIRRHCSEVTYIADADRVRGATRAMEQFGADTIVLDDGFQHRRLGRTLDIVLIDATCPFGFDRLLPRGLLREPISALRRAQTIILTRSDQISEPARNSLENRLRHLAPRAEVLRCVHRVTSVVRLNDQPNCLNDLQGRRVVLFAGIGNPASFSKTAESLLVKIVKTRWWPDHHRYRPSDILDLHDSPFPSHDHLLTTEKDAVKLAGMEMLKDLPILVVRVAIDFLGDDGTILQQVLMRVCTPNADHDATLQAH